MENPQNLSITDAGSAKTLLKMSQWKQAYDIDIGRPASLYLGLGSSENLYVYFSYYEGQILIEIYDGNNHQEWGPPSRYGYVAPLSIKDDLIRYINTLR